MTNVNKFKSHRNSTEPKEKSFGVLEKSPSVRYGADAASNDVFSKNKAAQSVI